MVRDEESKLGYYKGQVVLVLVVSVDGTSFRDVSVCVFLVQCQYSIVHLMSLNLTIDPNTSLQKVGHGVVICTATGQKTL